MSHSSVVSPATLFISKVVAKLKQVVWEGEGFIHRDVVNLIDHSVVEVKVTLYSKASIYRAFNLPCN